MSDLKLPRTSLTIERKATNMGDQLVAHEIMETEVPMSQEQQDAYQQIIGMGITAIPFILREMAVKPGQWFWALKSISGEDPVAPECRGNVKEMTNAWLKWGKERGYIY